MLSTAMSQVERALIVEDSHVAGIQTNITDTASQNPPLHVHTQIWPIQHTPRQHPPPHSHIHIIQNTRE